MFGELQGVEEYLFLLFLFFLVFFFFRTRRSFCRSLILVIGRLWVSRLFAWPFSEPLRQLGLELFVPLCELLLPLLLEDFTVYDLPSTLIQLPSVFICSGICSSLILGVHPDFRRVLSCEGLGIQTQLNG